MAVTEDEIAKQQAIVDRAIKDRDDAKAKVLELRRALASMEARYDGDLLLDDYGVGVQLEEQIEATKKEVRRRVLMANTLVDRSVEAANRLIKLAAKSDPAGSDNAG